MRVPITLAVLFTMALIASLVALLIILNRPPATSPVLIYTPPPISERIQTVYPKLTPYVSHYEPMPVAPPVLLQPIPIPPSNLIPPPLPTTINIYNDRRY